MTDTLELVNMHLATCNACDALQCTLESLKLYSASLRSHIPVDNGV